MHREQKELEGSFELKSCDGIKIISCKNLNASILPQLAEHSLLFYPPAPPIIYYYYYYVHNVLWQNPAADKQETTAYQSNSCKTQELKPDMSPQHKS